MLSKFVILLTPRAGHGFYPSTKRLGLETSDVVTESLGGGGWAGGRWLERNGMTEGTQSGQKETGSEKMKWIEPY